MRETNEDANKRANANADKSANETNGAAIAERMWREVVERLPSERPESLARIRGLIDILAGRRQPVLAPLQGAVDRIFMPDLPSTAWPAEPWFPRMVDVLERSFEGLRAEALAEHHEGRFRPYGVYDGEAAVIQGSNPAGWNELRLWDDFKPTSAVLRSPVGASVTRAIVEICPLVNAISFLAMTPGTRLPPHSDRGNWLVSTHMGLVIPKRSAIRVGSETHAWPEGKCLWFDNSFEHEAWNESDTVRLIFAVHHVHPGLTAPERQAVKILQLRQMVLQAVGAEAALAWARG